MPPVMAVTDSLLIPFTEIWQRLGSLDETESLLINCPCKRKSLLRKEQGILPLSGIV